MLKQFSTSADCDAYDKYHVVIFENTIAGEGIPGHCPGEYSRPTVQPRSENLFRKECDFSILCRLSSHLWLHGGRGSFRQVFQTGENIFFCTVELSLSSTDSL